MNRQLKVSGMSCGHCVSHVKSALSIRTCKREPGVPIAVDGAAD